MNLKLETMAAQISQMQAHQDLSNEQDNNGIDAFAQL